ncbi:MAG: hypothetical protein ACH34X_18175 [Thiolinea sp.]
MLEHGLHTPNTHTDTELDAAYAAGYNACHDGLKINPYPANSILAQQWQAGRKHYDADYNPEYYQPQYLDDL